ncbi:toll-like receptor 2 [Salmo trutta]|uniref:Toll-like receptor 2 n=1 Tax=Salmo trutta TaxID=8032 RepID=A0A673WDD9_SALTR|nr:toll-like receptor 2 [Salmo trutta]XP_029615555.1 toll-like receptor 2 [Salmo trutta]
MESLAMLVLLFFSQGQSSTPEVEKRSTCDRCDERLFCDCSSRNYRHVPTVTVTEVVTLDLSFNDITTVAEDDLREYTWLRTLDLRSNRIQSIHEWAFHLLQGLESLDLSYNQLAALNPVWFSKLLSLQHLNLLGNCYRTLGPGGTLSLFRSLTRLRFLRFGNPALEEVRRGDLAGVRQLDQLEVYGNNLKRYDPGSLGDLWPLRVVTLRLRGPFQDNLTLVSSIFHDVSYSETFLVVADVLLSEKTSAAPFSEINRRRVRSILFQNATLTDEAMIHVLEVMDGASLESFGLEDATFYGTGAWKPARRTHLVNMDTVYFRNIEVMEVFKFTSFLNLGFLLKYLRQISIINCKVYVMPCLTSHLLTQLEYLDLSSNLLTDLTLTESLCHGHGILRNLRVINVSDNALKSLSIVSKLVTRLDKLIHLDISQNAYTSMPPTCSWPQTLTHLNISWAKLQRVTHCLPLTLEILDLGHNDLTAFHSVALPVLRELHLSGNKLRRLPPGWLFPSLEVLLIQSNTLNMFGPMDLQLYRKLRALQAGQNRFVCSCEFVYFMVWRWGGAVEGSVELTDRWDNYLCDSPLPLQGQRVDRVRLSPFQCHRILVVSALCGCVLASGILFVILLWKLHVVWYVRMMWAWLKAKRNSGNQRRRDAAGNAEPLCYDAFVSYSEQDAEWVEEFLVPELENSQPPLSLCLHKRDFLPGHWIIDNIINAMERSRRTLFVLSEHFVHSNWCRYELDFSHFRLFDGDSEAAVLVLLEPISKDDVPKRFCKLRKLMSSRTYLEWPQEDERRAEFWSNLRLAVRGGDEL